MTNEEKQEEMKTVGQVGMVNHPDGSQTRVRVVADHGPTMEVETLDETENYTIFILTMNFTEVK